MDYDKMTRDFEAFLDSPEGKQSIKDFAKTLPPPPPKGWLSIEEHLPMWMGRDFCKGYSAYTARDKEGILYFTHVSDHNTWYYMAKEQGIIEWYNP